VPFFLKALRPIKKEKHPEAKANFATDLLKLKAIK
jgi:hypothetical protein